MKKLTKMDRDELQMLLQAHSDLCATATKIGKRGIIAAVATTNTYDDHDFLSVTIDNEIAKASVAGQKAKIEKALAKYGVSMK